MSLPWMAGGVLIDNDAARIVVCADHEVQKQLLSDPISTTRPATPFRAKDEDKVKRHQAAIEEEWIRNGCCKDSSGNWVVPEELIWRSMPGGEDR